MKMERKERVRWLRRGVTIADSVETLGVDLRTRQEAGRGRESEQEEVQGEILDHQEEQGLSEELHEDWGQEVAASRYGASKDVGNACSGDSSN